MKRVAWIMTAFAFVTVLAAVASTTAFARRPPSEPTCLCPDVFQPVICSDGVTYSNLCQAGCAGATGCVPTGDI